MTSLLVRLFGKKPRTTSSSKKNGHRPGLRVEELETRALMTTLNVIPMPVSFPGAFSDGNFATPALAAKAYQYDPTGTPWTYSGMAGVSSNGSGFTGGNPYAPGGAQVAFLQQTGSMSQSFSLSAGAYSISFQDAQRANVQAHFQAVNVLVDGKLVDVVIPTGTQYTFHETPNFTVALGGTHSLRFQGIDPLGGDNTVFLTGIQINPAASTPNSTVPVLLCQALTDGSINHSAMLGLFTIVEAQGAVTSAEIQGLQTLLADAGYFQMPADVKNLLSKVVNGDPANAHYQGGTLGNLYAGSPASQLQKLVSKWFLGLDRPVADASDTCRPVSGTLFGSGVSYADIRQGGVGDCWFVAPLEEAALQSPGAIQSMFVENGDHTYTVRFFHNGAPDYVTVDNYLPTDASGNLAYAHSLPGYDKYYDPSNKLWVALAEKAYAQINESGWIGRDGSNTYAALAGGWPAAPLSHITGNSASASSDLGSIGSNVYQPFLSGQLVAFCSNPNVIQSNIVHNHCYALLGISMVGGTYSFTLGNPWGTDALYNGLNAGIVTLSETALQQNFASWAIASPGAGSQVTTITLAAKIAAVSQNSAAGASVIVPSCPIGGNVIEPSTLYVARNLEPAMPQAPAKGDGLTGSVVAKVFTRVKTEEESADLSLMHRDEVFARSLFA